MIAIWTKLRDSMHYVIYDRMNIAITFFYIVTVVLQPAAALSLIHQLGSALQVARKREVIPFVSRPWKRTLDWILVGVTFVIYIAALGNNAAYVAAVREGDISTSQVSQFSRVSQGLGHTTVALVVILSLNVVFSLISLFVEARHAHWSDQVIFFYLINVLRLTILPQGLCSPSPGHCSILYHLRIGMDYIRHILCNYFVLELQLQNPSRKFCQSACRRNLQDCNNWWTH